MILAKPYATLSCVLLKALVSMGIGVEFVSSSTQSCIVNRVSHFCRFQPTSLKKHPLAIKIGTNMSSKFELFQSNKNGQYYFRLKAANGEPILASEGYTTKSNCSHGIDAVKANAPDDTNYERLTARNNQYYFTLKTLNGQIIGVSEMYVSTGGRNNGIESVKKNAPIARIVDLTS
jgi:uncharacterized protein YegP (UPF0339 family)